jgi:endonuclease YncB( thermonuclease family)
MSASRPPRPTPVTDAPTAVLGKDIPYYSLEGRVFEHARVAKVYDGDTVTIVVPLGERGELRRIRTRLAGLDAREITGADAVYGRAARRDLVAALNMPIDAGDSYDEEFFDAHSAHVDVHCHAFDKYGRVLVDIAPSGSGGGIGSVNAALVASSEHFTAYDGTGPRPVRATLSPAKSHDPPSSDQSTVV